MSLRTRSEGAINNGSGTNVTLRHGASSLTAATLGLASGTFSTMTDYVTPEFTRKRNLGEIVSSPMEKITITAIPSTKPSSWIWVPKAGVTPQVGSPQGFTISDPISVRFGVPACPISKIPQWDETLAGLALAASRSNAAKPEAQLLVSLGEVRETLNMIDDALQVLLRRAMPFQALQRRYYRGEMTYRDLLEAISGAWLTYRYGIMPLVYDIQGYINALTKATKPVRLTARAVEKDSGLETWTQTATSDMISSIGLSWSLNWSVEYRATCLYEFADDMQARLGLRLADVPSAGLELIRLSFIADWFVNLSDFVSSLTLAARSDVRMQCVSSLLIAQATATYYESGTMSNTSYVSQMNQDGSGAKASFVYTRKTRKPYTTSDVGVLSPRVNLSWKRIADAAALLATSMDISDRKTRRVRI